MPALTNVYKCVTGANDACYNNFSDNGANLLSSHIYIYDNHGVNYATAPTAGKLTQERDLIRYVGTGYSDPRYRERVDTYDTWGNPRSATGYTGEGTAGAFASVGARTSTTCYGSATPGTGGSCVEDSYHSFIGWETNALGYLTSYSYAGSGYTCATPTGATDPNNVTTSAGYDAFCRLSTVVNHLTIRPTTRRCRSCTTTPTTNPMASRSWSTSTSG